MTTFNVDEGTKENLLEMLSQGRGGGAKDKRRARRRQESGQAKKIEDVPGYHQMLMQRTISEQAGIINPFFRCHQAMAKDVALIDGREYLNFSTYDYLGINGHEALGQAAAEAFRLYGSTAGGSRMASGERPPHRELEKALAEFLGAEDALTLVGGYTTNTTVLSHLFGPNDLIVHDALSHNSLVSGAVFSGAARFSYPHNDMDALDQYLSDNRAKYDRAIIVTEGIFSMGGTICPLPRLAEIKKRHQCFLMVDEAHSVGVLGKTGRGVLEYFNLPSEVVDIQMGTLSKSFCGCGGYIAGSAPLIEYLKYTAPGFLFSVAMSPPLAASCRAALRVMIDEPERVERLHEIGLFFIQEAQKRDLDTGGSFGFGVIPIIVGGSLVAGYLATGMYERGVNVLPVIHPVVEESLARLRFFVSAAHKKEQIVQVLDWVAEEIPKARQKARDFLESARIR